MHFGNMDEVFISFDIPGNKTVNPKGARQVSLGTTGNEKSNFTIMLSVTADGTKLAPLEISQKDYFHPIHNYNNCKWKRLSK